MRDENAFNAKIAEKLKRMEKPGPTFTHYLKAADRFRSGVSDFLIWRSGITLAMENKYIKGWGNPGAALLNHTFDGAQQTFLESQELAGCKAFGLVGVADGMYLIHRKQIPESGNWKTFEFQGAGFPYWEIDRFEQMIDWIFQGMV